MKTFKQILTEATVKKGDVYVIKGSTYPQYEILDNAGGNLTVLMHDGEGSKQMKIKAAMFLRIKDIKKRA